MRPPDDSAGKEQRLLRNARREASLIMALWAATLIWSVTTGYKLGYHQPADAVPLILGMPAWVFWSVVLPWGVCLLFSIWFCFVFMADDDLGEDQGDDQAHA